MLGLALGQVGAFALIGRDVEQVVVAVHPQVLVVAQAHGALATVVHAPVQGPLKSVCGLAQHSAQRDAVQGVVGMGCCAAEFEHRGRPVHGQAVLLAHAARGNASGPVCDPRHADAAFGQVHLAAHQRPVVAETLTAVVAGEDDQGVVQLPGFLQSVHHPTNALVHVVDHAVVGVDVAAIEVKKVVFDLCRQRMVLTRFPRPMRGGVVQAQKEGRALRCAGRHAVHKVHGLVGNQIGQVAVFVLFFFVGVQIVRAVVAGVAEVVHPARHGAKEFFITRLQGAEVGRVAQVPFAHQRGAVAAAPEQRGQRGVLGRQAQRGAALAFAVDRLFGRAAQAVLVARRHERKAGGRAHGRVGIALCELEASCGQLVEHGRDLAKLRVTPAVAAQVGKTQVVGHDEDDVGALCSSRCGVGHGRVDGLEVLGCREGVRGQSTFMPVARMTRPYWSNSAASRLLAASPLRPS